MKTSFIIAVIIVLHKIPKTKGKEKFECPVDCPPNVYRPICSRGKSYANLCVLQQEICKGKTAREIYDDVESCPGFKKEDDASGKSVETIDKNGVIFRYLIEAPKKEYSDSTERSKHLSHTVRTMKKSYHTRRGKKDEQSKRCSPPCSLERRAHRPLCIIRDDFFRVYPLQVLYCKSFEPTMPILVMDSYQKSSLDLPRSERPSKNWLKKMRSKNRGSTIDTTFDRKFCRIKCDINEYRPVCAGKRAYRSECYVKKAFCSGSIGKNDLKSARSCPRAQNKRKRNRN